MIIENSSGTVCKNAMEYVMLCGADGSFLRIVPEMLGFIVIGVLEYILVQKSLGNYYLNSMGEIR